MLQELNQASLDVGLSMNFKKTKIMRSKHAEDTNRKITIDNNEIEEVHHYICLGQQISMETASKEQEIKRRITLGWQAFGRASAIFKITKFQRNSNLPQTSGLQPMHHSDSHLRI